MITNHVSRLAIVASYFPDFSLWLQRAGECDGYVQEAERELAKSTPELVTEVCQQLLAEQAAGQESVPFSRLPFEVARRAETRQAFSALRELAKMPRQASQPYEYDCKLCSDTGTVTILWPDTVEETLRTRRLRYPYTGCVCCTCPRGRAYYEICHKRKPPTNIAMYDPRRHILAEMDVRAQYEALLAQAKEVNQWETV
jgi:hypothetical protein